MAPASDAHSFKRGHYILQATYEMQQETPGSKYASGSTKAFAKLADTSSVCHATQETMANS
jgi:hypothetical protein